MGTSPGVIPPPLVRVRSPSIEVSDRKGCQEDVKSQHQSHYAPAPVKGLRLPLNRGGLRSASQSSPLTGTRSVHLGSYEGASSLFDEDYGARD